MNTYVSPNSFCRSPIRFRICACTDTSSADVGSSQTRNSASVASARAIEMRCRCPPENSCGKRPASLADRPTSSSSSSTRRRVSAGVWRKPSVMMGSATMLPTRQRGFRLA
ncbi:hypothetical protein D3C73_1389420 [compost metagenome]